MDVFSRLTAPASRLIVLGLLVSLLGCPKNPSNKPDQVSPANRTFDRANSLVQDTTLTAEGNPNLARALQDFYSLNGCVGVGYGTRDEAATVMAAAAYKANMCRAGEPAKTIRFKAHNGTFYCVMSTNASAYEFQPGK